VKEREKTTRTLRFNLLGIVFDSQAREPGLALAELLFWRQE